MIKRSSRANDLKKSLKLREMSSISTLEVAWENKSLWPRTGREERDFCYEVAETNKLELLKWAREEKKCEWDARTINAAAYQGNLEMVKYCVANEVSYRCGGVCICCRKRSSRGTQILTRRSQSALVFEYCQLGGCKMVIFTYLNILLSVSMINMTKMRVIMRPGTATWTV